MSYPANVSIVVTALLMMHRLFLPLAVLATMVFVLVVMSAGESSYESPHESHGYDKAMKGGRNQTGRHRWGRRHRHRRRYSDRWKPHHEEPTTHEDPVVTHGAYTNVSGLAGVSGKEIEEQDPDDPSCHTAVHTGYSGDGAVVWGMNFKLASPADCCKACQAHAAACGKPGSDSVSWWAGDESMRCGRAKACQIWTFCPEERCFAFDVHKHLRGECWLKYQVKITQLHLRPVGPSALRPIGPWADVTALSLTVATSQYLHHQPVNSPRSETPTLSTHKLPLLQDKDYTKPKDPHFGHKTYPEVSTCPGKLRAAPIPIACIVPIACTAPVAL